MWLEVLLEAAEVARKRLGPLIKERVEPSNVFDMEQYRKLLDMEAETAVEETLRRRGIRGWVISEEALLQLGSDTEITVIVDPVDGTTNLSRGFPLAAVSLCVSETRWFSGVVAGLIMNIYNGDVYWAERGQGAFLNGHSIFTSKVTCLTEALLSIDMSKASHVRSLEMLFRRARHLRQLGSAALSLSFVAGGLLDAYVDIRGLIRVTDVAAGLHILREAGGVVRAVGENLDGVELKREKRLSIVASANVPLMNEILESLELDAAR